MMKTAFVARAWLFFSLAVFVANEFKPFPLATILGVPEDHARERVDYFLCDFTADCSHRERTEKRGRADGVEVEDADIESQSIRRVAGDEILVRVSESAQLITVGVIQARDWNEAN